MRRAAAVGTILMLLASPSGAEEPVAPGRPAARTVAVTVYGKDACPKPKGDEVVVCGRRPDNERYRIPKELRKKEARPSETSWAARSQVLDEAARAGRPNSCSPAGTGGQTGCWQQMMRQWRVTREQMRSDAANQP